MTTVRQRKKTFSRSVEDLDAFPKVPESYVEQEASSAIGNDYFWHLTSWQLIIPLFCSVYRDIVMCGCISLQRMALFP